MYSLHALPTLTPWSKVLCEILQLSKLSLIPTIWHQKYLSPYRQLSDPASEAKPLKSSLILDSISRSTSSSSKLFSILMYCYYNFITIKPLDITSFSMAQCHICSVILGPHTELRHWVSAWFAQSLRLLPLYDHKLWKDPSLQILYMLLFTIIRSFDAMKCA